MFVHSVIVNVYANGADIDTTASATALKLEYYIFSNLFLITGVYLNSSSNGNGNSNSNGSYALHI